MHSQAVSSELSLASRRRPRRGRPRRRAREGVRLPDWAWGLFLGVVALLVGGGIFVAASGGLGGGGGACDKPLVPLDTSDISAKGFAQEDAGLARVIDLANQGAIDDVESAFYGPVHNFTHNADPPIREKDPELAKQLCEAVLKIEDHLAFGATPLEIAVDARGIRDLLRQGAQALGYQSP